MEQKKSKSITFIIIISSLIITNQIIAYFLKSLIVSIIGFVSSLYTIYGYYSSNKSFNKLSSEHQKTDKYIKQLLFENTELKKELSNHNERMETGISQILKEIDKSSESKNSKKQILKISIVYFCPDDAIEEEKEIIKQCNTLSKHFSNSNINLIAKKWSREETDLTNKSNIGEKKIFISIFWKSFQNNNTYVPTKKDYYLIDSQKYKLIYFLNNDNINPKIDPKEYNKIFEFRRILEQKGDTIIYIGKDDFGDRFFNTFSEILTNIDACQVES